MSKAIMANTTARMMINAAIIDASFCNPHWFNFRQMRARGTSLEDNRPSIHFRHRHAKNVPDSGPPGNY
jgi:hypothetical protein